MRTIQLQLETFHESSGLEGAALTSKVKKEMKLVKDNLIRLCGGNSALTEIADSTPLIGVFIWADTLEGIEFWSARQYNIQNKGKKK